MICLSIVSHGQIDLVRRLIACIERDRSPVVSQVIYTRNVVEPEMPASWRSLPGFQVIDNPSPRGFGSNHNAAFSHCRQPYFCVLNPDIEWSADPMPGLIDCFAEGGGNGMPSSDRGLGLVAPVVVSPQGGIENTARALYTVTESIRQKVSPRNLGEHADWLAGMFLLFDSDAYSSIGGFDERYFLYIEDVDICTRLRLAGWTLHQCPRVQVVHDARNASHRSIRYSMWHLQGMLRYWSSTSFWRYRSLLRSASR